MNVKIALIICAVAAVAIAVFGILMTDSSAKDVEELKAEWRKRGLLAEFADLPVVSRDIGKEEFLALRPLRSNRLIPRINLDSAPIAEVKQAVRSAKAHYASIEEFALLENFATSRPNGWGIIDEDFGVLTLAAKALYARGIVEIVTDRNACFKTLNLLKRVATHGRTAYPGSFPLASTLSLRYYRFLLARLADSARDQSEVSRIEQAATAWPPEDRRGSMQISCMQYLDYVNAYAKGTTPHNRGISSLFRTTPRSVSKLRVIVLRTVLNQYDNWENVKPAETPMFVPSDEIEVNLLKVIEFEAKHMKRSELEDEATYGALLLQIKARDRFLSDGSTPNIRTFENYGVDVSDPLTGKPFVLRMENGIPRIYGERKNRRSLQPEEPVLTPILSARN